MNAQHWFALTLVAATLLVVGALPVGNGITTLSDAGPVQDTYKGVGKIQQTSYNVNIPQDSYNRNSGGVATDYSTSNIVNDKTNGFVIVSGDENYGYAVTGDVIGRVG